jgi:hypothetical protein
MSNDVTTKEPSSMDFLLLIIGCIILIGLFGKKTEDDHESR